MAHTSSFSALIGQEPPPPDGVGTTGGGGLGTTGGVGQDGVQPCTAAAKARTVRARNRASFDGAISIS